MREMPNFHQESVDNGSINQPLNEKINRNNPNNKPVDPEATRFKKFVNRVAVGAAFLGAVGLHQFDKQDKDLGIGRHAPQKQGELKKDNKAEQKTPPTVIIPEDISPEELEQIQKELNNDEPQEGDNQKTMPDFTPNPNEKKEI